MKGLKWKISRTSKRIEIEWKGKIYSTNEDGKYFIKGHVLDDEEGLYSKDRTLWLDGIFIGQFLKEE